MTVSDLKLRLFRQIDTLEKNKLEEIYSVLINYINGQKDISEWEKLSNNQKHGILNAMSDFAMILEYLNDNWDEKVTNQFIVLTENNLDQISINPRQFPIIY